MTNTKHPVLSESNYWPRAIILVDMDAFFAAVEQRDQPALQGKPVAITNGESGTCIITCSYEARAYGIKTGMRLKEALLLCPPLVCLSARHKRYIEASHTVMQTLQTVTPDIEIFSIDEAFLDVTRCQRLLGDPIAIGHLVQKSVYTASGLTCSIGISSDKTTAKYAANCYKPKGFYAIPPSETKAALHAVPVTELCGIGEKTAKFLARYGVYTCGDMQKLPIGVIAKRFGHWGRRIWLMCQGADPEPVHTTVNAPKSMGHGKVMPPNTQDKNTLLTYLYHLCEKLAARLRNHGYQAQRFFIGWKSYQGWLGEKCTLAYPSQDGKALFDLGKAVLSRVWDGQPVYQIQVTALDPGYKNHQRDFFETENTARDKLNNVMDTINQRYGERTIAPAPLIR